MVERALRPVAERNSRFDGANAPFEVPVPAETGVPGQVFRSGDVGTGQPRELSSGGVAGIAFAEVAAVDKDVSVIGKALADLDELLRVLVPHGVGVEHRGAEPQRAGAAMGNDMDRVHVLLVRQVIGDLLDAVA